MFIKAKNGNVVEVADPDLAKRAATQGHEVSETDPRAKAPRAKAAVKSSTEK